MENSFSIDALLPAEMAHRAETLGIKKAEMNLTTMFILAVLAGAFIALGGMLATIAVAGGSTLPYSINRLLAGLTFCLGLILVVIGGAELFTGNNLVVIAWAGGKVSTRALLRNWLVVYAGNFVGAISTAFLMYLTRQYTFNNGAVGTAALSLAQHKVNLDFVQATVLGMMCNALVCLAVWLTYSARTTTDKIAAIIFPITAFVAAGFEHSIANMYFLPLALFIKGLDSDFARNTNLDLSRLSWDKFIINNLLPVTIGNIIGGGIMVAAVYWFIYLRPIPEK